MSVTLFKFFVKSFKQSLPRQSLQTGIRRIVTAMNEESIVNKDLDNEEILRNKDSTRYKRRHKERQWEDRKLDGESDEKKSKPFERIKRKKVAMLLGYSGVDYYGMQRNPGVRTIEEDLLKALLEAKYITEEDFNNQQNAKFQRSSRTDKGVSAARQVVSMKLPLEINIEEINKRLPECIRVFGVKRVTNKFNSKVKCNARTYSYTTPTYVFEPSLVTDEERKGYRISAEKLTKVNELLALYKGTKSYHNFTEKKHFQDPSSSRYMMSFGVDRVFVHSDMEFAVLLVKGQSFMLHQIRKMIGLVIAVVRGHADPAVMEKVFGKEKVMIPTAPGLGLVLDMVHYDRYDARYKNSHDTLTWQKEEVAVQKFKEEFIYPNIVQGEIEGKNMAIWLEKLNMHSYEPDEATDKVTEAEKDDNDEEVDDDDECEEDSKSDREEKLEKKGSKSDREEKSQKEDSKSDREEKNEKEEKSI